MKLLEQHHAKLAQLLKFQNSHPISEPPEHISEKIPAAKQPLSAQPPKAQDGSPYRPQSQSLPAAHRAPRDISSSIVSNLASARGIPSNRQRKSGQASSPALAHPHVEGKIVSPQARSKLSDTPAKPAVTSASQKVTAPLKPVPQYLEASSIPPSPSQESSLQDSKSDEPFQRFYSTFESLFSKLSAPLAFAGLPLTPEDKPQPEKASSKRATRSEERATVEPEYSRLFSKAALRAVREEPGGNNLGAAESFYVVPTTGGTLPYASILARGGRFPGTERDGPRTSEEADEFVDARETPGPPSPNMTRGGKKPGGSNKTMEELQLENEGLRSLLDNVTRRLFEFEMGAQSSSMALHQSIKASLRQSPAASVAGGADAEKVEKLEEQMKQGKKELERMGRENEKLKGVVGRYRERWEKLKEGARVRREGTSIGKDEDM